MQTVSEVQVSALAEDRQRRAVTDLVERILQAEPELQPAGPEALSGRASAWMERATGWGFTDLAAMAELHDLHGRWGGFEDPDSAWILDVLAGTMNERDKLGLIMRVIDGHPL